MRLIQTRIVVHLYCSSAKIAMLERANELFLWRPSYCMASHVQCLYLKLRLLQVQCWQRESQADKMQDWKHEWSSYVTKDWAALRGGHHHDIHLHHTYSWYQVQTLGGGCQTTALETWVALMSPKTPKTRLLSIVVSYSSSLIIILMHFSMYIFMTKHISAVLFMAPSGAQLWGSKGKLTHGAPAVQTWVSLMSPTTKSIIMISTTSNIIMISYSLSNIILISSTW